MAKRGGFEDRSDDDFQENFGDLSTTTPTLEDSEEDEAIDTDHEGQANKASTTNCDKNCSTICTDDHHTDDELELIENAFEYLIKKKYPPGCSKNQKGEKQRDLRSEMEKSFTRNKEGVW